MAEVKGPSRQRGTASSKALRQEHEQVCDSITRFSLGVCVCTVRGARVVMRVFVHARGCSLQPQSLDLCQLEGAIQELAVQGTLWSVRPACKSTHISVSVNRAPGREHVSGLQMGPCARLYLKCGCVVHLGFCINIDFSKYCIKM